MLYARGYLMNHSMNKFSDPEENELLNDINKLEYI